MSEAVETLARSGDMGAKPAKSFLPIIFAISIIGVTAVWVAFLIWLVMRVIF
jgi:hypothetical protein